jgi:hypothetical protein
MGRASRQAHAVTRKAPLPGIYARRSRIDDPLSSDHASMIVIGCKQMSVRPDHACDCEGAPPQLVIPHPQHGNNPPMVERPKVTCGNAATLLLRNLGDQLAPAVGHQDKGLTPIWSLSLIFQKYRGGTSNWLVDRVVDSFNISAT